MNSLIFNTTASELKASVYGRNNGSNNLELLQLDSSGNLLVNMGSTISVEVTNTDLSFEISNTSLSVDIINANLTVEISNTGLSVDITNSSLTVEISNTGLSVDIINASLTVEISNTGLSVDITNPSLTVEISNTGLSVDITNSSLTVDISNTELTVMISGNSFTFISEGGTGTTGTVLITDMSTFKTATVFIDNSAGSALTVSLMISPDNITYFPSPNHNEKLVEAGAITVIAIDIYAHYSALAYNSDNAASFNAYLNAQV